MPPKNVFNQIDKFLKKAEKNNFNQVAETKINNVVPIEERVERTFTDQGKVLFINAEGTIATSTIKAEKLEFIKNLRSPVKTQLKDFAINNLKYYINGKFISENNKFIGEIDSIYQDFSTKLKQGKKTNQIPDGQTKRFIINGSYDGDIFVEGTLSNSEVIVVHNTYTSLDTNTYEASTMHLTKNPPLPPAVFRYPPAPLPSDHDHTQNVFVSTVTLEGQEYGNGEYIVSWSSNPNYSRSTPPGVFNDQPTVNSNSCGWQQYQYSNGVYQGSNSISDTLGDWLRLKLPVKINLSYLEFYVSENDTVKHPTAYTVFGTNDNGTTWTNILKVSNVDLVNDITRNEPSLYNPDSTQKYRKYVTPIIDDSNLFDEYGIVFESVKSYVALSYVAFYGNEADVIEDTDSLQSGAILRITQGNVKNIIDTSVGPTDVLSVSHSGNLGIKTKYPIEKLDVRGNIKVSGNINDTSSTLIGYTNNTKDSVQYQLDLINENITTNNENMISHVNNTNQETSNYTIRGMINQVTENTQGVQTYIEDLIDNVANTKQDVLTMSNGIKFNTDKNFIELIQESEWNTEQDYINYGSVQLHRDSIKINDKNVIFSDEIVGKEDNTESNTMINNTLYLDLPPNKVLQISEDFDHPMINTLNGKINKIQDEDVFYTIFTDTSKASSITFKKFTKCDILLIGGGGSENVIYTDIRKYPPSALTGGTTGGTVGNFSITRTLDGTSSYTYGNGDYVINWSSSESSSFEGFLAFDGYSGNVGIGWISAPNYDTSGFSTNTNSYIGTDTANYGEFIKIQLPVSIYLTSIKLFVRSNYDPFAFRNPRRYVVYGSNDGITWDILIDNTGQDVSYNNYMTESSPVSELVTAYSYFAFTFTKIGYVGSVGVHEIELYGKEGNKSTISGGVIYNKGVIMLPGKYAVNIGKGGEGIENIGTSSSIYLENDVIAKTTGSDNTEENFVPSGTSEINDVSIANISSQPIVDITNNQEVSTYTYGLSGLPNGNNGIIILKWYPLIDVPPYIVYDRLLKFPSVRWNWDWNANNNSESNYDSYLDTTIRIRATSKYIGGTDHSVVSLFSGSGIEWSSRPDDRGHHMYASIGGYNINGSNVPCYNTTDGLATFEYKTGYKGDFVLIDLGKEIYLDSYKIRHRETGGAIGNTALLLSWRIYGSNDDNVFQEINVDATYNSEDIQRAQDVANNTSWELLEEKQDANDLWVVSDIYNYLSRYRKILNVKLDTKPSNKYRYFMIIFNKIEPGKNTSVVLDTLELFGNTSFKIVTSTDSFPNQTDNLVAWYKFEGNFEDSSGNGYHLTSDATKSTLSNKFVDRQIPTFTNESVYGNQSVSFKGNTNYNSTPSKAGLLLDNSTNKLHTHISNSITISLWVYTRGKGQINYGKIFSGIIPGVSHGNDNEFSIFYANSTEKLIFQSNDNKVSSIEVTSSGLGLLPFLDRWVHIAWIIHKIDDNNTNTSIYIDGVEKINQNNYIFPTITKVITDPDTNEITNQYTFVIGAWDVNNPDVGGARDINGYLDDFRIYNRVLTPDEISELYNYSPPISNTVASTETSTNQNTSFGDVTTDMLAWYKFDGDATDSSGNGMNLNTNGTQIFDTEIKIKGTSSVSFDGNTYYSIPSVNNYFASTNLSISFWIYGGDYHQDWQGLIVARREITTSTGWNIYKQNMNGIQVLCGYNGGWHIFTIPDTSSLGNSWVHITVTFTETTFSSYVNSELKSTETLPGPLDFTHDNLEIGSYPHQTGQSARPGTHIDDVRIYNRELTVDEISELYNYVPGANTVQNTPTVTKVNVISTTDVSSDKLENISGLTANVQQQIDDLIVVSDNVSSYLTDITIQPETNMSNYVSDVYNEFVVNIESKQDKLIFGSNINYDEATNTVSISGASIEVQSEVQVDLWKSAIPDTKFGNNLKNLYAWYKFDGIYNDHSKNKNIAIPYNSPTFDTSSKAEGTSSLSMEYTIRQYLQIPSIDISVWDGFTMSFWMYIEESLNNHHIIDFGDSTNPSNNIILKGDTDNNLTVTVYDGTSVNEQKYNNAISLSSWNHFAVTIQQKPRFIYIAAEEYYTVYIDEYNNVYITGNGYNEPWYYPPKLDAPNKYVQVVAGRSEIVFIDNEGNVYPGGVSPNAPTTSNPIVHVASSASKGYFTIYIDSEGNVEIFPPSNDPYNLGDQPPLLDAPKKYVFAACGTEHIVYLDNEGNMYGVGRNNYNQLDPPPPENQYVKVFCGAYHTVYLDSEGNTYRYGDNSYGQITAPITSNPIVDIACGIEYTIYIDSEGNVEAFGYLPDKRLPPQLTPPNKYVRVDGGWAHTVYLDSVGNIYRIALSATAYNNGQMNDPLSSFSSCKIYKNNVLLNPSSSVGEIGFPTNGTYDKCYIAKSNTVTDEYFKGRIDDFRLYNNIIAPTDINDNPNPNLYVHYKFDGNLNDDSGNNRHIIGFGQCTFDDTVKNVGTHSASFAGGSPSADPQYLKIQGTDFSKWLDGISLCFWVYFDIITGEEHIFDFSNSYDISKHIIVKRNLDKLELIISGNVLVFDYTFTATEWKHIIISLSSLVDGSSVYELFIDGTFIKSYVLNYFVDSGNYDKCFIGIDQNESAYFFNGKLDDVRIYSKTTTQEETLLLYNYPKDFIYENPPKLQSSDLTTRVTFKTNFYNDTTDMMAWYKFDGDFTDSSGNGKDLTGGTGTSFVDNSVVGIKSISFPNTSSQGLINTVDLSSNKSFTISFWSYRNNLGKNDYMLSAGNVSTLNQRLHIGYRSTNAIKFGFWQNDLITSVQNDVQNKWIHLTFTYNSSDKKRLIYKNGVVIASDISNGPSNFAPNLLYLGGIYLGGDVVDSPFDGKLDDLRIYNRALTSEEIRTLYADTVETFYNDTTDMLAWYKFDAEVVDGGALTNYGNLGSDYNATIKLTDGGIIRVPGDIGEYKYKWTGTSADKKVGNWVNLPDNILEKLNNGYTFSWWSVDNDGSDFERTILSVKKDTVFLNRQPSQTEILLSAHLPYGGNSNIYWDFGDGLSIYQRLQTTYIPLEGELAHWVVTKEINGSNQLIKVYRNNVLIMSGTYVNKNFPSGDHHNMIGVNHSDINAIGDFWDKSLEDFRIYNRALTSEEIGILSLGNEKYFSNNTTSMMAWYKFDGDFTDSSGNGKDLTGGTGTSFVDNSVVGIKSISFPKLTGQRLSSTVDLSNNTSFSISLWIYRDTIGQTEYIVSTAYIATNYRHLSIGYYSNNVFRFAFFGETLDTPVTYTNDVNIWVHWTCTYNSTDRAKKIYRNGILVGSGTSPSATNFGANSFILGDRNGNLSSGKLDDVRVYNRAISAQEVTELYETTKKDFTANDTTDMLAWYKFDGDFTDSSGNGKDLTKVSDSIPVYFDDDAVVGTKSISFSRTEGQGLSSIVDLSNDKSFSVSLWIYRNTNDIDQIISTEDIPVAYRRLLISVGSNYNFAFHSSALRTVDYPNDVNKWIHLTFTYHSRERKIYRNGILVANDISGAPTNFGANSLFIGKGDTRICDCKLDDVRVYNRALSEDEIYKVYMNKSESRWTMSDMQKELIVQNVKTYPSESKNNFQLYGSNDKLAYQLKTLNSGWNLIYDTQNISLPVIKKQLVDSEYYIVDEKDTILESDIKNHIYNVVYDALPNTWYDMETIAKQNGGRLPTKTEMDNYVLGVNSGIITNKIHKEYDSDAAIHSVWFGISEEGLSGYTSTIRPFYRIRDVSGTLQGEVHSNSSNPGGVNNGNNNIFKWIWYITDFSLIKTSDDGYYYDLNNVVDFELVKYPREPLTGVSTTYSDGIVVNVRESDIDGILYGWKAFDSIKYTSRWSTQYNRYKSDGFADDSRSDLYFKDHSAFYGEYIIIDLGEQIVLDHYIHYGLNGYNNRSPVDFRVYATNDNSAYNDNKSDSWIQIDERIGVTGYADNTGKTFTLATKPTAYRYFAIITNKNGGGGYLDFSELELYGYPLLSNITYVKFPRKLYTAPSDDITFSSTDEQFNLYFPYKAFDGITYNISNTYFTGQYYDGSSRTHIRSLDVNINGYGGEWLRIDMKENIVVNSYQIYPQNGDAGRWARAPGDFKIFGSKDNITHYELDSRTNLTWPSGNSKIFEISNNNENYRYYTIVVNKIAETLATGNYAFIISEWELYGDPKSDLNYSIEFPTNKDVKFITSDAVNTLTFEQNKTYHITKHENSTSINIFNPYIHPVIIHNSTIDTPTQISNTNEYYYSFTSTTGTNSITFDRDTICDILVVGGGGGGGGRHGAGGGAGGLIYETNIHIPPGTYSVVVGSGGAGGISNTQGYKGGNSSFNGLVAIGGGAGQHYNATLGRQNGGSGGGGTSTTYGLGINGQGNDGGISITNGDPYNWAGGGGAGEVGGNSTSTACGKGGNGLEISITGLTQYYAGGGGGGSHNPAASTKGLGGLGGGGDGGTPGVDNKGDDGEPNTGGGGGGASTSTGGSSNGGNGASGIVIIRWTANPKNLKETLYETSENIRLTWSKIDNYLPYRYYLVKELTDDVFTEIELVGKEPNLLTWNNGTDTSSVNIDSDNNTIYIHDGGGNYHRISTVNDLLLKEKNKYKFLPGLQYNRYTSELSLTNKWSDNLTHLSHKNIQVFDDKIEIGNKGSLQSQSIYTTNIRNNNPINIGDNITVYEDDKTYCVKASDNIWLDGANLTFTSDERIKKEINDIDDDSALDKIMKIEPKSYKYIDSIKKGDNEVFGFISQQVKEVLPEATSETSKFIPNIYKLCKCEYNKIFLPTDLDVSRLVSTYNGSNISNVVRLIDKNQNNIDILFSIEENDDGKYLLINYSLPRYVSEIFVYGTLVDDLTTIEKSYIYTLNVCATQVINRKITDLTVKNETLNTKSSEIEQRLAALESKISNM